jgi:hypothetical protein
MGQARALIAVVATLLVSRSRADAEGAPPSVSVPDQVVGDGRTAIPVEISALPATGAKVKELPVPEVATVRCVGASAMAAVSKLSPAVLAPVVTRPTNLECVARSRTIESTFRLAVRPPPPGIYASAAASDVRSTARELVLDPFVWDGKARLPPSSLRFAASDGAISSRSGKLVLELTGNGPRLVAIALADGNRLGAAFVPVTGVTTIPIESEPGANVQCWIAGRWFGPVKTKGKIAKVPIEVPPGVTHGVARSTGRAGYVTDAITDLKVPALPRIAAVVASSEVRIGESATIAVAIAGNDGRPGQPTLSVIATARRGTLGATKALGGGLWSVPYTAPTAAGVDHVTIRIEGDPRAGTAELDIEVGAGGASRIEIDVPPGPYAPGAEIAGTARVFDGAGNPLRDAAVTATLAGAPLVVTGGEPIAFRGRVPERLPDGDLVLELTSGRARGQAKLGARILPLTAAVRPSVDGRSAIVELAVRDGFGNLAQDGSFELLITGGRLERLTRDPHTFRASVVADPGVSTAQLVVRAGGRILADARVQFEPPAHAFVVGVWANGGWVDNLGELASPRGGAGLALRRGLGGIEVAALVGAEGLVFRDTTQVTIDGTQQPAARSVEGVGIPIMVRGRIRVTRRFGVALGGGLVPIRVKLGLALGSQAADERVETVIGVRAQLHGDVRLGPGRLVLGAAYGRAALSGSVVVGQIEGVAVVGGYEWWFADFGW